MMTAVDDRLVSPGEAVSRQPRRAWPPPSTSPGDVHVLQVWLDDAVDERAIWSMLDDQERQRAHRLTAGVDRRRYLVAHAFLRTILATYLQRRPGDICFTCSPHGKPRLLAAGEGLEFNLSHSRDLAMVAIARGRRVGVDAERHDERLNVDGIARRFFSRREQDLVFSVSGEARLRAFHHVWTRKEAAVKAIGKGLGVSLATLDVLGDTVVLSEAEPTIWQIVALPAPAGYSAALAAAVSDRGCSVRLWAAPALDL
jgi:4'-phosphopantetheinyl transferase